MGDFTSDLDKKLMEIMKRRELELHSQLIDAHITIEELSYKLFDLEEKFDDLYQENRHLRIERELKNNGG